MHVLPIYPAKMILQDPAGVLKESTCCCQTFSTGHCKVLIINKYLGLKEEIHPSWRRLSVALD